MNRPICGLASLLILLAVVGCNRAKEPAPEAKPADTAAAVSAKPAEPAPAPLTAEQVTRLVRAHSPVLGSPKARVTVVEFLDPACGGCAAFSVVVKQILFVHSDDVRVVVRFAAFHEGSAEAIRLLEAARRQGKFEELLTALFDRQDEWASHHAPDIKAAWRIAANVGLDMIRAKRDAGSAAAGDLLRVDDEDAIALQVLRTPTFFVNAKPLPEFTAQTLMDMVASEVASSKAPATAAK